MLACHAGGRGFESRPLRHLLENESRKKLAIVRAFLWVIFAHIGGLGPRDIDPILVFNDQISMLMHVVLQCSTESNQHELRTFAPS
jgi:hypothetical protein